MVVLRVKSAAVGDAGSVLNVDIVDAVPIHRAEVVKHVSRIQRDLSIAGEVEHRTASYGENAGTIKCAIGPEQRLTGRQIGCSGIAPACQFEVVGVQRTTQYRAAVDPIRAVAVEHTAGVEVVATVVVQRTSGRRECASVAGQREVEVCVTCPYRLLE